MSLSSNLANWQATEEYGHQFYRYLNAIHNIVVAVDYQGRIVVFNPACEHAFNCPAEKAIGRLVTEVIPGTGLIKVLKTGKAHIGRKFILNNKLYIANRTPVIYNNKIIGAIGVAQEVSELQDLVFELEEVRQGKRSLESILNSCGEGIVVIDGEKRVCFANHHFGRIMGVENGERQQLQEMLGREEELLAFLSQDDPPFRTVIKVRGRFYLVFRSPWWQDGAARGVIGRLVAWEEWQKEQQAVGLRSARSNNSNTGSCSPSRYSLDDFIGRNEQIVRLKEIIKRVARGPSTVLLCGESGTGKELLAHALHHASPRSHGPFVKVNCAAVPETLLESELFGYQEGAFTGARRGGQCGKFELAHGGTIFLDEIGDMPLSMQAKLLRVLQEKEIERLGDARPRRVDVRVVAATNRDLAEMVEEGLFRRDLFYRINVVTLNIPPLRERMDDLPILCEYFLERFNREFGLTVRGLRPEVWEIFYAYSWPGNVRELVNVIERAFNLVEGEWIDLHHLPSYLLEASRREERHSPSHHQLVPGKSLSSMLAEVEKDAIVQALRSAGGNKMQAAKMLGISRAWLYKKMKYYGIED